MNIDEAATFANYQATLTQQKKLIKFKFDDNCIFPYNGGIFKLTLEFVTTVQQLEKKSCWLLDSNQNPIWIDNTINFYLATNDQYQKALEVYAEEYTKLKSQRSVSALVNL